jgi:flagellin-like protein
MWQSTIRRRPLYSQDAVSPVIGVVLMVAITVILAAVIASFVYGMPLQIQKPWQIGVSINVKQIPGDIFVVTMGGGDDFKRLVSVKGSVHGDYSLCPELSANSTPPLAIGAEMQCLGATPGSDHVVIVGHFNDGSDQVLLDTYL